MRDIEMPVVRPYLPGRRVFSHCGRIVFMRRAAGAVQLVIKNILIIGFTVQICLGLFWMAGNFAKVQDFTPVDTGVYPFLLGLAGRWYGLIYLLQLSAALYAGYRLLKNLHVEGRGICLWGSLAMMTLPMAMQCHLALLPYSLVGSLELLEISFVCEPTGEKNMFGEKALWGSLVCFAAQCLLWPKYFIPGLILPLLLFLRRLPGMLRKRERLFRGMLLAVCFLAVLAAGYGAERSGEGSGNASGWSWRLVKRFCWPTIWVDWGEEPEAINVSESGIIWVSAYYPRNMDMYLKPELDAMTPENADSVMRKMVSRAWSIHYPMVVRQIGWDVLGYSVTPVILPLQLEGDAYDSCSGRNYETMRNGTPVLAKYYVKVSCSWFTASLVLLAGAAVLGCIKSPKEWRERLRGAFPLFAAAVSAGAAVLFFTMQGAGIMDYKYTVWVNQLWIAGSIVIAEKNKSFLK